MKYATKMVTIDWFKSHPDPDNETSRSPSFDPDLEKLLNEEVKKGWVLKTVIPLKEMVVVIFQQP